MTIGDKSTLYKIKKVIRDFANWVTVPDIYMMAPSGDVKIKVETP